MHRNGQCRHRMRDHMCEHGLRMTAAREAILDVVSKIREHATVEEIYLATHKKYPKIGLTTVYRTLEVLVKMGFVQKIDFGEGKSRYELGDVSGERAHHHHIVCTQCGKIINYSDFSDNEREVICDLQKELEKKYCVKIMHHSVQYYGECDQCLERNKK